MNSPLRLITRIGMFSALFYVISFAFVAIPNVNPGFFIVFSGGFLWGMVPGLLVGAVGMASWTFLNPFGPAPPNIAAAQIFGMSMVGLLGWLVSRSRWRQWRPPWRHILLAVAGIASAILFFLPVSLVDALVYKPFWPRFNAGLLLSLPALVANAISYPILFVIIVRVYDRERSLA